MLPDTALRTAMLEGQKQANLCTTFCRIVSEIDDGRYRVAHNGVGARDTDAQVVHADKTLNLPPENLAGRLATWIRKLHRGDRVDLNGDE